LVTKELWVGVSLPEERNKSRWSNSDIKNF
jgi:hypothetical protein